MTKGSAKFEVVNDTARQKRLPDYITIKHIPYNWCRLYNFVMIST